VDHEKSVVAVKPGIVAVQAQDTARACEVNFTASYHGPMDFVRRPFSEKNGGVMVPTRANPKTFRIWSPFASRYCTTNRLSIQCPSELAVRVALNASEIGY